MPCRILVTLATGALVALISSYRCQRSPRNRRKNLLLRLHRLETGLRRSTTGSIGVLAVAPEEEGSLFAGTGRACPTTRRPHRSALGEPGTVHVTLTVDGRKYSEPITVGEDPRVTTPQGCDAASLSIE